MIFDSGSDDPYIIGQPVYVILVSHTGALPFFIEAVFAYEHDANAAAEEMKERWKTWNSTVQIVKRIIK